MKLLLAIPTKYVGNMTIAMRAVATALKSEHDVTLLIDDNFADLAALAFGHGHKVISYPRGALSKQSSWSRIRNYLGFISLLRRDFYDAILDLDGSVVSGRLVGMARGKLKIGPGFAKRLRVYDQLVPIDQSIQHCFEDYRTMLTQVDLSIEDPNYLRIPPVTAAGEGAVAQLGLDANRPIATIHPSATKDYKQWDIQGFAALADWLSTTGWQVVIVGAGEGERARVAALFAQLQHPAVNAYNRLSITELIMLFQRSNVFVGNDSGPMHLATASGCQVIALFGPTELVRWRPRGTNAQVLKGPAPCSPQCQPEACLRDYQCMTSLSLEQVQAAVLALPAAGNEVL